MHIRAIIQSRLSSSRLPGKAMLMLEGMPTVVLCAKRASNTGVDVVVATSEASSDDPLASTLSQFSVPFIRGALDDVLHRFVHATNDLPAGSIVVRLTADNILPDGRFIEEITGQLRNTGLKYIGTHTPIDGLPYGVSAEAFIVDVLREAAICAVSTYDREHVTPWIRRMYGAALFVPEQFKTSDNLCHLRATLDTFQDYLRINRLFSGVADPIGISWHDLCLRLRSESETCGERSPYRIVNGSLHSELTLGTAQLGMPYGATNVTGQPSFDVAISLIRQAVSRGVTSIDCARAYGTSESIVGSVLADGLGEQAHVVTKLDPLNSTDLFLSEKSIRTAVDASVYQSCRELGFKQLPTLLLHRWEHYSVKGGIIWQRLIELQSEGVIGNLGVSVYTPAEAAEALNEPLIRHIQLPFNILDHRWKQARFDTLARQRPDVVIHARSVFLQGILISDALYWPKVYNGAESLIAKLDRLADLFGLKNRAELCFSYTRSQPWITSLVVGMDTIDQLNTNITLCNGRILTEDECRQCETELAGATEELLNPATWNRS